MNAETPPVAANDTVRPFLHGDFRRILSWHRGLSRDGLLPAFEIRRLMKFPDLANRMVVADRVPGPEVCGCGQEQSTRYTWRYAGSNLRDSWGKDWTARDLCETHGCEAEQTLSDAFDRTLEIGRAYFWRQHLRALHHGTTFLCLEQIMVPFTDKDGTPRHVVGVARVKGLESDPAELDGMYL